MTRAGRVGLTGGATRRRAVLVLAGLAGALAVVVIVLGFLAGNLAGDGPVAGPGGGDGPGTGAGPQGGGAAAQETAQETALAIRPMLDLPADAASPHALAPPSVSAGPPLVLPGPQQVAGRVVAGGFPQSPEGAVAALVALTSSGLAGGDPAVYDAAYGSVAEPGAVPAAATYAHGQMVELRSHAQLAATGPVPGVTIGWTPSAGQIKGVTGGGSYVVACVLGELHADADGRGAEVGLGDCQAMRWTGGQWRVASGAPAAIAPSAWPGSAEAGAAGYREIEQP